MKIEDYILLRDHLWNLRYEQLKECRSSDGLTKHPLYNIWISMLKRCYNPNDVSFPNYGARGIDVCKRWWSLKNFISDMGNRNGLSLDRKDNDKGYSPDNCRWATYSEQANNKRDREKEKSSLKHSWIMKQKNLPHNHMPSCFGGL